MDYIENMSTLPRHGHIVSSFFADVKHLFQKKLVYPLQEQHALVYWGRRYSGDETLVDVEKLTNLNEFRGLTIEELAFVQPDFFVFAKNPYIQNLSTSRTAGIPDLIVEVWSTSNTLMEKDMKFRLYSSSSKCEHWYITLDSNSVECWLGDSKLSNQSLEQELFTIGGLKFDLRYLAQ